MPRYFFHIHHERHEHDEVGAELADRRVAWREATKAAGQILQGLDGRLTPQRDWTMEETDEFANTFRLHVSEEEPRLWPRALVTGLRLHGPFSA